MSSRDTDTARADAVASEPTHTLADADLPVPAAGPGQAPPTSLNPAAVLALQRTAGNQAAGRWLSAGGATAARWTVPFVSLKSDEELIRDGVAGDATAAKEISDYTKASEADRFALIHTLLNQGWVGPRDEYALEAIWRSFGARLREVASPPARFAIFKQCVDRGAELDDLPALAQLKADFGRDVKATAGGYMTENREYVNEELQKYAAPADPAAAERQAAATADIQEAARKVARAEEAQRALRALQVGWEWEVTDHPGGGMRSTRVPASFDPAQAPMMPPRGDEDPPLAPYAQTKSHYDRASDVIRGQINRNPGLYAAAQDGGAAAVARATPAQARELVTAALRRVGSNIDATLPKLDTDDLDWRDLRPIHAQLFSGQITGVSGTDWSQPFTRWVAQDVLSDHESHEFWVSLGLGTLAAAAFVVASLATAGSATFFIAAAVGIGASGLQAGMSWENYEDLARAEDATVSDERSLLARGQASAALVQAALDTVFLFLDVYGVAAHAAAGAAARAGAREALEAGEHALGERATREAGEAAAHRGAAEAGEHAAEATLHAEAQATVAFGDATHTLKAVRRNGRLELWLCTNCARLIEQIDEVLPHMPTSGDNLWATERLQRIRARAVALQERIDAGEIPFDRIPGEVNQLAEQLRNLGTRYPAARGLEFFKGFRARPDYDSLASQLGFTRINQTSHGQPIYRRGQRYISPDIDRHNGGVWKMAQDSPANLRNREMRQGTYNEDLSVRVGD